MRLIGIDRYDVSVANPDPMSPVHKAIAVVE